MKKIIAFLLMISMTYTYGACSWDSIKTQTNANGENEYVYSKDCHIKVGQVVSELDLRKKQSEKQEEVIKLSELGINMANQRADEWKAEAYRQHAFLERDRKIDRYENAGFFILGIASTILSAYTINKAIKN